MTQGTKSNKILFEMLQILEILTPDPSNREAV